MRSAALTLLALLSGLSQAQSPGVTRLAAGPGDVAYATTADGLYATDNGGATWTRTPGDEPESADNLEVGSGGAVFAWGNQFTFSNTTCSNRPQRSADGGRTWARVDLGRTSYHADRFASSPGSGFVLAAYTGFMECDPFVARSGEDGSTWTNVPGVLTSYGDSTTVLTVRRARAAIATGEYDESQNERVVVVYRSDDAARTWSRQVTTGAPALLEGRPAHAALAPDGALYAWSGAVLYRLSLADSAWVPVPTPPGTGTVGALDVADDGTLHLGTDAGAFVSADGFSWTADGLAGRSVTALERTGAGTLLALADSTAWRRQVSSWSPSAVGTPTGPTPSPTRLAVSLRPNPFSERFVVSVSGGAGGAASVEVFDVLGRRLASGALGSGAGVWETRLSLPPGVYLVAVTDGAGRRAVVRATRR